MYLKSECPLARYLVLFSIYCLSLDVWFMLKRGQCKNISIINSEVSWYGLILQSKAWCQAKLHARLALRIHFIGSGNSNFIWVHNKMLHNGSAEYRSAKFTFKSELTVDDSGNALVRNHFQKERSSLASFQLQEILQLSCSWDFIFESECQCRQKSRLTAQRWTQILTNFYPFQFITHVSSFWKWQQRVDKQSQVRGLVLTFEGYLLKV